MRGPYPELAALGAREGSILRRRESVRVARDLGRRADVDGDPVAGVLAGPRADARRAAAARLSRCRNWDGALGRFKAPQLLPACCKETNTSGPQGFTAFRFGECDFV